MKERSADTTEGWPISQAEIGFNMRGLFSGERRDILGGTPHRLIIN